MKTNYILKSVIVTIIIAFIFIVSTGYFAWSRSQYIAELEAVQNEFCLTKEELKVVNENFKIEIAKTLALNEELNKILYELDSVKSELEESNSTIADLKNSEYELVYMGNYKLTHYCTEKRKHICGLGAGITATGTHVTAGRTIAVDPSVIPYGTEVYIEGYGWRVAEDCGGGVNGQHIDIAVETHSKALSMGITSGGVWVLIKKNA